MATAIGIAASQAGGLRLGMGSMIVPLVHAQGAEQGLRAALLAQAPSAAICSRRSAARHRRFGAPNLLPRPHSRLSAAARAA